MYNTLIPYSNLDNEGVQYTTCVNYAHISRYRNLRQIIHCPDSPNRFISLETPNSFNTSADAIYHRVNIQEVNRLDIIAYKYLGSAKYSWVIAYFNNIEDGYTVREGQQLRIPKNLVALFQDGEVLAPVSAFRLNLGSE